MTESMRVTCLTDRYWNPGTKTYQGSEQKGTLIEISVQHAEEKSGVLIPVGIVLLDDNTFQSIPLEFMKKETNEEKKENLL